MYRPAKLRRLQISVLACTCIAGGALQLNLFADAPSTRPAAVAATIQGAVDPIIARIREEGLNHSHVDQTLDYLCNVIGQRLTGSPSQKRASEWTRDKLAQWGLSNAHLEPWGPFGRGWSVERFSLQVIEPYTIILNGYPKAWSPGFDGPMDADAVYLDAHTTSDLAKYAGKLKGKVVLIGAARLVEAHFDPQATRMTAEELTKLASSKGDHANKELLQKAGTQPASKPAEHDANATTKPSALARNAAYAFAIEEFTFAAKEGAAAVIDGSNNGDGGTLFVAQASIPTPTTRPATGPITGSTTGPSTRPGPTSRPKPWAVDAPATPPQITLTREDFNRMVRMITLGQHLKLSVDLRVKFYPLAEVETANTIAEIPGSDLKDQVVMVGGHLDSWHSGTGATDNGVGSACAMEAIRLIRALNLHPRRTIRIALWTGEEQGIYGSAAYVKDHFGAFPEDPKAATTTRPATRPLSDVIKKPEFEQLSVYFNLDNGSGKIRGIYAQDNTAAAPYFRQWLKPFADLGADTITLDNTGSTDHISFDKIGLPGFQFIQDTIEYNTRTHHSNADVFDRIQMDDMKQASTIMAALLWDAANTDARFPRKTSN